MHQIKNHTIAMASDTRETLHAVEEEQKVYPLSAFADNYIWIIQQGQNVIVVDPGDATPVILELTRRRLDLKAIFVTHHHADHTGGIQKLVDQYHVPVYGPAREQIPCLTNPLREGDQIQVSGLDVIFSILETPGHTLGHIVYYSASLCHQPALFSGDTLFSCGSGRLFEGNSRNMQQSLDKFREIPQNTKVFSAHEYTLTNISWALQVEPNNEVLQKWSQVARQLRANDKPTLPTELAQEFATNPFLRLREPTVIKAASKWSGIITSAPDEVLASLREWKNSI